MNLLAFDTSTETLSIAVQRATEQGCLTWQYEGLGGAQASSQLIPQAQSLLAQAQLRLDQLQAIVFGAGPGSFTGLRTACSVAQGLAFAANVPVLPVDTLLAVAEDARAGRDAYAVLAALDARMDEVYAGRYVWQAGNWSAQGEPRLLRPEQLEIPDTWSLAGNIEAAYGARLPADARGRRPSVTFALPRATALLRLAPALLNSTRGVAAHLALPRYVRDKVAQTTQERAAARAGAAESQRYSLMRVGIQHLDALTHVEALAHRHPWDRRHFEDCLSAGYEMQLILSHPQEVLGYFVAMKGVDEVHLLNITVAPKHQRQGWGRILLDALQVWARSVGASWMWLEVRESNRQAQAVYRHGGWQTVGARQNYYPADQGQRETALVMRLKL